MESTFPTVEQDVRPTFRRVPVGEADPALLGVFLRAMFGQEKGQFLEEHGSWWHRGDENRFAILAEDGQVAAYYTTTPTCCLVHGRPVPTLWWIDLMVEPAFRRQGLQKMMDDEVRGRPGLKLGIPNGPHAKILARHGWYVRDDLRKYLLPLRPHKLPIFKTIGGLAGRLLRLGGWLASPMAAGLRVGLGRYRPKNARQIVEPKAAELSAIYEHYRPENMITTCRDTAFIQWRYLDAPYREQLRFYLAGPLERPTHYLISRDVAFGGLKATRILDIFGDFEDTAGLKDMIRLAIRDAVHSGANQITVMADLPSLRRLVRRLGFWLSVPIYFCFHDPDPALPVEINQGLCYWTIGDSDNDNAR